MRYGWQRASGSGGVPTARSSHSVVAVKVPDAIILCHASDAPMLVKFSCELREGFKHAA